MLLPEIGVRRPVTTAMVFIGIIVLGLVSLSQIGIDMMPDLELPTIGVITHYSGAGAEDVESRITEIIEEKVSTVPNLDKVESISQEGVSVVMVKFKWGADLSEASNDIRDKIDLAKRDLPDDCEDPYIFKFNFSMMPIIVFGVMAEESYPRLYHIIEKRVCDPLKTVSGVATAVIRGGLERQILVNLDRQRLEAHHLSINQVVHALKTENLNLPGGHLKTGKTDFLVRTPGELTVPDIEKIVLTYHGGAPVYLRDVAHVKDDFKEVTREVRIEKRRGLIVMVQKQSGTNAVEVTDRVMKKMEDLKRNLPPDVQVEVAIDFADQIKKTIFNLRDAVFWGGFFVILVVLFFLRNIRGSLIVVISIPTSLIISFILMFFAGYTINMMSLSSLAIAVGMVVDCSIVVLENIHRHRETGGKPGEVAVFGTSEVGTAVVASTLTTVAIFFPIAFLSGITGIMFRQLAFVVSITILASLFTALTLVPMLSSKLLGRARNTIENDESVSRHPLRHLYAISERWFVRVEERYRGLLGWALSHRKTVIGGGIIVLVCSILLVPVIGTEFMPIQDRGRVEITFEFPEGTRMEETGKAAKLTEDIVAREVPERTIYFSTWGYGGSGTSTMMGGQEGSNIGRVSMRLVSKDERKRSDMEISNALRPLVSSFPGARARFSTEDPIARLMFGGSKPLVIEIKGYDLDVGRDLAHQVANILQGIKGVTDVDISRKEGKPELQIIVDREKSSNLGLNVVHIANTVRSCIDGVEATKYREAGDEYKVWVRLREEDRQSLADIANIFVTSPAGEQVRLSNIAQIKRDIGPVKIERETQERLIKVTADLYERDLGSAVAECKEKFSDLIVPEGFAVEFGGAREEQEKSFRVLFLALILGIILVYMVMASQFESLREPFIIIFSVPFAMIGVIWALVITGQTLSVISFIGLIMLVGIVVNNAIVLVDYINILRARGLSVSEAVRIGGKDRLRPVLMTAITTIFGLLPLALSRGEGSETWNALGIAVIGGLTVSTLITLIFVPTLYSVFEERKAKQ
ncbi:MAG: efflux RND transporter permease subunit [Thermodesulfobacteriota bacterium]|nr:efflux RND transporter permease subunit [Thermodesulfobacteriota bacterium]